MSFGANPASYAVYTGALSQGIKKLGFEADHSPPSSVKVKNASISLLAISQ
jgi:hypothetical protein